MRRPFVDIGGAVVVAFNGFETAILATLLGMIGGAIVAAGDAGLRAEPPGRTRSVMAETA